MKISMSLAKRTAVGLLRKNRSRSWRTISREDYQGRVNHATLNRFANSKGAWVPKDEKILRALGLIKPRSPFAGLPKWFERTDEALSFFNGQRAKVKQMSADTRNEVMKAKGVR